MSVAHPPVPQVWSTWLRMLYCWADKVYELIEHRQHPRPHFNHCVMNPNHTLPIPLTQPIARPYPPSINFLPTRWSLQPIQPMQRLTSLRPPSPPNRNNGFESELPHLCTRPPLVYFLTEIATIYPLTIRRILLFQQTYLPSSNKWPSSR